MWYYSIRSEQPGVAQLGARLTGGQEAVSSSLATRTKGKSFKDLPFFIFCGPFKFVARKRAAFAVGSLYVEGFVPCYMQEG